MYEMNQKFSLLQANNNEPYLWTRDTGKEIREKLFDALDNIKRGEVVVIDFAGIKAFDFSFANELFGKTLLKMPVDYPGKFVIVENLTDYTRENLFNAISNLSLAIAEKKSNGAMSLLGKVHPVDEATFNLICQSAHPMTTNELVKLMDVKIQAMNERLSKLVDMGVIRRSRSLSQAGREQYEYTKIL